jgi:hypothetical protein
VRTDMMLIAVFENILQKSLKTKIEMYIGPTTSLWFKHYLPSSDRGIPEVQRRPVELWWVKRHCTG